MLKLLVEMQTQDFVFKDTPFTRCVLHLNNTHIETAEKITISDETLQFDRVQ